MVCRSILVLSAVAVSVAAASARAAILPVLGYALPTQIGILATAAGAASDPQVYAGSYFVDSFGAYSAKTLSAMTGPVSVTNSVFGGNDPSVSASALISGNPAFYTGGYLTADGHLQYYFEVTGPAGGYAPVDISATGGVSQDGPGESGALAELQIVQEGGALSVHGIAAVGSLANLFSESQFSFNQMYLLPDNTPYGVTLDAKAVSSYVNGAFLATAFVDPTIELDPSASVEDHLFFSPNLGATDSTGVTPVPEPSSMALLGTGLLGLAGLVRRRWPGGRQALG